MLDQGTVDLDTPDFTLTLVRSSQTVAALKPKGADGFDFTPGDLNDRSKDGYWRPSTLRAAPRQEQTDNKKGDLEQPTSRCMFQPTRNGSGQNRCTSWHDSTLGQ
jgi:hypothetical protein